MALQGASPVALALLLAMTACAEPATAAEEAPVIRGIAEVVILTPSGAAGAPKALYTEKRVRRWLSSAVGERYDEEALRRKVARHYEYLGYRPEVAVALRDGELHVRIAEAPGIVESVVLGPEPLRGRVDPGLIEGLDPIDRPHVLARALRTQAGTLLNHERLARDEYDLSRLGYDIVPVPGGGEDGTGRRGAAVRAAGSGHDGEAGKAEAPDGALPRGDPRGSTKASTHAGTLGPTGGSGGSFAVVRRPRLGEWREARDRLEAVEGEGASPPIEPLRMSWVGTEAEYTRRQLFVARLFYERAHLLREFDGIEVSPYVAQQLAGAIRYRLPYLLGAAVTTWNVFTDVKLYDEFVPDRLLDGVETDERRRGGRIAFGVEPFRDRRGHTIRAEAWVNRYHVTFGEFQIPVNGGIAPRSASVPGGALNDVNLLGIEAAWAYHHEFRAPRFWWEFRPRGEIATKAWGGDIAFRRLSGELRQHYAWSPGLELDTSWKGGVVDRDVPVFEEFALGGATSLRGFLRDDFLGRRYWSAQNDLWVPIPFRAFAPGSDLMAALQRSLKTAIIFDAGSVSFEETLDVRFARGAGLGLRWQAEGSPLVVRADAAWGFWRGERRFYPYLSFTRSW